VDLAGSERVKKSLVVKDRLAEACAINKYVCRERNVRLGVAWWEVHRCASGHRARRFSNTYLKHVYFVLPALCGCVDLRDKFLVIRCFVLLSRVVLLSRANAGPFLRLGMYWRR
jgi:hypothetical protein